jgi:hypothetical protein
MQDGNVVRWVRCSEWRGWVPFYFNYSLYMGLDFSKRKHARCQGKTG